ncbi:hypothetical protein [Pelagibaculum spongiae]|uniref:Uncharacterized protein n=1 Tax=Pelagibaculum spongiae TaxID=2080658 RepID=A0A2V1GVD1_9GAMM|nr:hypothetical protein [Pelagibaculum spongiae]PVZ63462.1 hypothetical protein DC094_21380 [Pelagibaculum spongiae]
MSELKQRVRKCLADICQTLEQGKPAPEWRAMATNCSARDLFQQLLYLTLERAELASLSRCWIQAWTSMTHVALLETRIWVRGHDDQALADWDFCQKQLSHWLRQDMGDREMLGLLLRQFALLELEIGHDLSESIRVWQSRHKSENLEDWLAENNLTEPLPQQDYDVFLSVGERIGFLTRVRVLEWLTNLLRSPYVAHRESLILFLLHPRSAVAEQAMRLLQQPTWQRRISSVGLRRLISMRNWLPRGRRVRIDEIIVSLRRYTPIDQLGESKLTHLMASSLDARGGQLLIMVWKQGSSYRTGGMVLKQQEGISDIWVGPPSTKAQCLKDIKRLQEHFCILPVDQEYPKLLIPHFLAISRLRHQRISPLLLQWFEVLGIVGWNPCFLPQKELLSLWRGQLTSVAEQQYQQWEANGQRWLKRKFAADWLEDDPQGAERVKQDYSGYALIAPEKEKWQERLVLTALWARHATGRMAPDFKEAAWQALLFESAERPEQLPLMKSIVKATQGYWENVEQQTLQTDQEALLEQNKNNAPMGINEKKSIKATLTDQTI